MLICSHNCKLNAITQYSRAIDVTSEQPFIGTLIWGYFKAEGTKPCKYTANIGKTDRKSAS